MNKAFLLIDKPSCCDECVLCRSLDVNRIVCTGYSFEIHNVRILHDKCPLKDLPQKTPCNYRDFEHYVEGYRKGWNDVIEQMTGEYNHYVPEPYRDRD